MTGLTITHEGLAQTPFIEQWLGVWAMREQDFQATAELVRGLNLSLHLAGPAPEAARQQADSAGSYVVTSDGVAMIDIRGRMQKQQASLGGSASTVATRRAIRAAAADPEVGSILMVVDSPGGTVAGTKELADDIAAAGKIKPVIGFAEDMAASAAYWAISQATQVFAQPTAMVGSIGTYGVVHDMSALAAKEGVKVHVIRAGAMKGAGTPGTEVTPEQLAAFQEEVNTLNEFFLAGVAAGRGMTVDQIRTLATGQAWIGQKAVDAGLIDGVATFDQALATARAAASTTKAKGKKMAAATYAEIVAACPGASAEFICDQLKEGATVEKAGQNFMAHQALALEVANKKIADIQAKAEADATAAANAAAAAKPATTGVDPLKTAATTTEAAGGSPFEDFQASVEAKVKAGMNRPRAVAAAVRENPERHALILAEGEAKARAIDNAKRKRT